MPGYLAELRRRGYTASPVKKHLYLLARLSRWLDEQDLELGVVATSGVEPFFEARRAAGVANLRTCKSLCPLIDYLRGIGVLPPGELPAPTTEAERVLEGFGVYLRRERGLVEGTVRFYVHVARLLVEGRTRAGGTALAGLNAHDVTAFTARVCERRGLSSCRQAVSALRSFLRYLRLEGVIDVALDDAVLSVAGWDPSLPRAISTQDVVRLLASCDRRRAIGRRDYAILLLLARLGCAAVRSWPWSSATSTGGRARSWCAARVAATSGCLFPPRWARRSPPTSGAGVPAPPRAGGCSCGTVAPIDGFADTGALRGVLARACARAGIAYVPPHRLRHTAATEMLRAGAALAEIGQVLRHRSSVTTSAYAKVDHDQLRLIARPWPGSAA